MSGVTPVSMVGSTSARYCRQHTSRLSPRVIDLLLHLGGLLR
jgi:hypothetical protein